MSGISKSVTPTKTPIDLFAEKLKAAARSKSQDLRLSIAEAQELSATLLQLQVRETTLLGVIVDLQRQLNASQQVIQVEVSGGTFQEVKK